MSDSDPTGVIKMITELCAGSETYRRNSRKSFRLSSTAVTPHSILSDDNDDCNTPPKRIKFDDSSDSLVNKTECDSMPSSPWEWRRLKGEVVSLRTRLSHQEVTVQKLHQVRRQMEEVFDTEKKIFEMRTEQDKQTIKQLEVRLDMSRQTVQEAREAQLAAEKELNEIKAKLELKISSLMNENAKLMEDCRTTIAQNAVPAPKNPANEMSDTLPKLEAAEARIEELEQKLRESMTVQRDFEMQSVELQNMKIRIEKLESERALWEEGKQLVARAAKASDYEKELIAAKETIANLRESVKGKLLLEEQVSTMKLSRFRLAHTEMMEHQVTKLEVKCSELQLRLNEYESIGIGGGPTALKKEVNRLQHAEAILTLEEGQLRSKVDAIQRECQTFKKNYEEAKKVATEMTMSREKLNKLVSRLQKKMMLITRERDSYRQQLDMYEKEMTTVAESSNAVTERIPALERVIDGYRELVTKLEADLEAADDGTQRGECDRLREEINRLRGELEHRALKGDFNCNARVLHFKMNPAVVAEQQAEEKRRALLQEVEELRAKVAAGENGAGPSILSLHSQEMKELKQTHEIKINRLKEAFKASSQEYRQACYQLFGWRVDRTKEDQEGVDLMETAFSATLGPFIERHLQRQHSVPMFLNAVQTELFTQQTVTEVAS
ncbi:mitotic spindle assembly checkpoint protein MAD1 isoform X2 [Orussus abietinus]|uniref:mitotic spindle assembly checkpoint protein MAD1 isoform X2 n=1 Tax=Orussus abietinus TaxID=222816 RepID=UPI000625BD60|nr:mitotic spindle assembly checkpoint protein MAD1 isoform X2 [Orussus abietinus]